MNLLKDVIAAFMEWRLIGDQGTFLACQIFFFLIKQCLSMSLLTFSFMMNNHIQKYQL